MFRFIFILILSCVFIGCTSEVKDNQLTIAYSADIRGFDPAHATDLRTGKIISLLYDNLVRFDNDMNLVPSLAQNWSVSKDGLTYTFNIRQDVRFHNNTMLTIPDIVESFERLLDPKTASPQSWLLDRVAGAREFMDEKSGAVNGLRKINDSTMVIELSEPFSPFIQYLAMPSTAVICMDQSMNISELPSGSGPWKFEKWERDGEIVVSRNDHYWDTPPKMESIKIRILSEVMTQSAEYETGVLDILEVPPGEVEYWDHLEHKRIDIDELNIWYIGMNCSRPPFDDIRLRRAMNYAIDKEKIINILLYGTATAANGPIPPQLLKENDTQAFSYDPERSIQLLKDAGFENGFEIDLFVAGGSGMFHVLEAIQSHWSAVGINVEIKRQDWNVFKTAVREGKPDLYYLDWFADYPDGENFLYPLFHSRESMKKRNRFSNENIDEMIEEIQRLPYNDDRDALVKRTNDLIIHHAPWVFLWHSKTMYLTQPWISGFEPSSIFNANRYMNTTTQVQ